MSGVFEKLRHSYLKPLETGTCRWFFSSSLSVPDYHSGLLSVTSQLEFPPPLACLFTMWFPLSPRREPS
jgi:hypothetical protein